MLKLLLCSAFIAPCFIIPLSGMSSEVQDVSYETTSFEEALIEPEFEQLDKCQSAELDIFFHENYITLHSAEYLAEGIKLSEVCDNANFIITPIIPSSSHINADDVVNTHTDELSLILKAHGISSTVAKPNVQTEFNSLSANGRTATLKIVFAEGDNA